MVIGINDYPDYRDLRGAIKDAEGFAAWLLDEANGGALPRDNVKLILSAPSPPAPLQDQIDHEMHALLDRAEVSGARRLYFYFAGHGCTSEDAHDIALCLAKWSSVFRRMSLSSAHYKNVLIESGVFREIVFFLDCCRVWEVSAGGARPYFDFIRPKPGAVEPGVLVAYAAELLHPAHETVVDRPDGEGVETRGVFTTALLEGLSGAAANEAGVVTASSLKNYLEMRTSLIAKERGLVQNARVTNHMVSPSDPVFGQPRPAGKPTGRVRINLERRSGEIVLQGSNLEVLRRGDAAGGPWEVKLPRGLYKLVETSTGHAHLFEYVCAREEMTDVHF